MSQSIRPAICTASQKTKPPAAWTSAAASATGWITPVSLFAPCRATSARPGRRQAASSQSRSTRPSGSNAAASAAGNRCPDKTADMLAGGDDEPVERPCAWSGAEQRIERRVRSLGAAGHERDATGAYPRQPRDLAPRLLDDPPRRPALGMDRGGIADRLHRRERGLARHRPKWRGRVIVEIGSVR